MIILAIYYTIADIVLLGQCFYYRGFTWRDEVVPPPPPPPKKKRRSRGSNNHRANGHHTNGAANGADGTHRPASHDGPQPTEYTSLLDRVDRQRRGSDWSDRLTHLSPAVPMVEPSASAPPRRSATTLQAFAWNTVAVLMVIGAGVAGWALSRGYGAPEDDQKNHKTPGDDIHFDLWGQIFGWLCAVLYLGSRLPQLLLNWRRKSTEGVSMLFFLFACLGNLTYVLSIFAFDTKCGGDNKDGREEQEGGCAPGEMRRLYGQYILVNLSWLAGSAGTLLLDMGIFAQFFIYSKPDREDDDVADQEDESAIEEGGAERDIEGDRWDQRPVLERSQSQWST